MQYWIIKSKFTCYSIDDFARDKKTLWTGIRNYLARNYMINEMKPGDKFFFYHSNTKTKGIYGRGHVVNVNLVDASAFDKNDPNFDVSSIQEQPKWRCAELAYDSHLDAPILLEEIKRNPVLAHMDLLQKSNRLSIVPIKKKEYDFLMKLKLANLTPK